MLNECGYVAVSMLLVIGKKPKFNEYSYIVRTNDNRNTHILWTILLGVCRSR